MVRIKDSLDPEVREAAYDLKDTLKSERMLERDYLRMNRTQFVRYLEVKAEAVVREQIGRGADMDLALHKASILLTALDDKWRAEAKRLNEAKS
jgi:uncharacterized protein YfdQ (DUF2303 family)